MTPAGRASREAHFRINECSCGLSYGSTCEITSLKCHYHNIDRVIYSTANAPRHNRELVTHRKLTMLSCPGLHSEPGRGYQVDHISQMTSKRYPRNFANVSLIIINISKGWVTTCDKQTKLSPRTTETRLCWRADCPGVWDKSWITWSTTILLGNGHLSMWSLCVWAKEIARQIGNVRKVPSQTFLMLFYSLDRLCFVST